MPAYLKGDLGRVHTNKTAVCLNRIDHCKLIISSLDVSASINILKLLGIYLIQTNIKLTKDTPYTLTFVRV